ncbi:hypothetical protein AX14_005263 [Amanita brunnescens Koide BX004]|nr:hypothetical protein AX14_005263 [Amanita brunnescens Koide BX004]
MTATENWDDDFEFNPNSPPRKKKYGTANSRNSDGTRMSTTSSRFTVDWDADPGDASPSRRAKVFTAPMLLDEAKAGPSTPARHITITENWDDDFEDKSDTPVRRTRGDQSSPTKEIIRNHRSMLPLSNNENDFKSLALGRNRASSSASTRYARSKNTFSGDFSQHTALASDVDEEDDEELGFADKDEDRTVTGRLRRPGLGRLNSMTNHPLDNSPPPPVPSLPTHLNSSPKPFPRSPSSSVFSLPTTIAGESMYYGSTAHLHPASRTSSSLVGLTHRPPTPPVQKERERRRLRKKNRPQPQGVFELIPVESGFTSGLAALHEVDRPQTPARDSIHSASHSRPHTPQTPVSSVPSSPAPSPIPGANTTPSSNRHGSPNPPPTPSGAKNALLSRIGSVKKWGVRRKRVSTTQQEGSTSGPQDDPNNPGRPASSLSSLPLSTTSSHHAPPSRPISPRSPNQTGGWFFRASGAFSPSAASASASVKSSPAHVSTSNSTTDLSLRGCSHDGGARPSVEKRFGGRDSAPSSSRNESRNRNRTPSRRREPLAAEGASGSGRGTPETPAKLSKRKSLGFMQLRRTLSGVRNGDAQVGPDGFLGQPGQPRHASYGAVSRKSGELNPDVFWDRENLDQAPNDSRGRKKSLSIIKGKMRQGPSDAEKPPPQDVGKAFTRRIKRISIIGRHTRQKSGTGQPPAVGRSSLGSRPEPMPFSVEDTAMGASALQPPGLLPPVEIGPSNLFAPFEVQTPPLPTEAEMLKPQSEDANLDIKPSLPESPPKTDDPRTPPTSPRRTLPKSPTSPERGASPQSVSLGRSAYSPTRKNESPEKVTPRRNSLGDLKIPARISRAQVGLRRDLGMVRDFAQNVEQLKGLQATYHGMVVEIQALLDSQAHLHSQQQAIRSVSPSFFSRPVSRQRSNTNPGPTPQHVAYKQFASEFYTINSKYRITWECAELLIELGGGSSTTAAYRPTTSVSAPVMQGGNDGGSSLSRRAGRERAITLACDESKPPSPLPGTKSLSESPSIASSSSAGWRASAGRQELTQRQMVLLKELLNSADPSFVGDDTKPTLAIPEEPSTSTSVNKDWKWGDPSNSTVTLPSEDSVAISRPSSSAVGNKKRRASRLGMAGLRDLLKMLKRHHTAHPAHPMPSLGSIQASTTSLTSATNSSSEMYSGCPSSSDIGHVEGGERQPYGRRRAKTSIGPESLSSSRDLPSLPMPASLFDSTPLPSRQSRGRPSLATIFRLPNSFKSNKVPAPYPVQSTHVGDKKGKDAADGDGSPGEEDWDRVEPPADLDTVGMALGDGTATVRGKGRSPYIHQPPPSSFSGSRASSRPKAPASGSRTSLFEDSPSCSSHNLRSTRLSDVDEAVQGGEGPSAPRPSSRLQPSSSSNSNMTPLSPPPRISSRYYNKMSSKNGSVRSMPPQPPPELKLAMAPENIKPLVENAKEVHARLVECVAEIRALLESHRSLAVGA